MQEPKSRPMVGNCNTRAASTNPQRSRLLLALVLLVVALVAGSLKDLEFWLGSDQSLLESDGPTPAVASKTVATPVPAVAAPAKSNTAKARIPRPEEHTPEL